MGGSGGSAADVLNGKKHTILMIDDNPSNLGVMVDCLSDHGFQVIVARNGETGLELAQRSHPDMILLDIMLPGISGFDVCQRLKTDENTRNIMVIFMTALTETQEKIRGFSLGAVDYITKPFQQDEVLARVTTHLRLRDLTECLEQNVRQRTEALTTTNYKLRQEITERKQIEEALRESEARYRAAIENSNDGIAIIEAGHHVFVNQKLIEILGYEKPEELIGKQMDLIFHPDDQERVARYNWLREKGRPAPSRYEAKGITKGGRTVYFDISATKITYRDRIAVLAFFKDTTQRKQLETQLQQAQKMEAIGTLAGGIAHDFNNILSAIIGHTELAILNKDNADATLRHLDQVLGAGQRAAQLIQQILAFSRQKDLERKPLQLGPLINEALKMLRASLPSSIDIDCRINDRQGMVMADATQIHQVLMNLCTNAAHAMRGEQGVLRIVLDSFTLKNKQASALKPGAYLRLSVEDNGHGMDRATLDRIFDPYFSTKKQGEGTGLGLAVVHGIISGYGGTIEVQSQPEKSTKFTIFLPRIETPAEVEEPAYSLENLPAGDERILFVDDEEFIVSIYDNFLKHLGYQVVSTTSSDEALSLFKKDTAGFDLVITDMTMPKLTGEELSRQMIDLRPDTPIIICTGYSNQLSKEEARSIGIRRYLMKPLVIDQLAHAVRDVLDQR